MSESILNSVKLGIGGIPEEYTAFDSTLIIYINGVFNRFFQLRIGPIEEPFKITGTEETWDDFFDESEYEIADTNMELAKADMILRVRLMFDPPSNSFAVENIKQLIAEYEWCMNTQVDSEDTYVEDDDLTSDTDTDDVWLILDGLHSCDS